MLFVMGWSPAAKAVVEIDITQGNIQPIPMAITNFVGQSGEDEALGRLISDVISANLERSGFLRPSIRIRSSSGSLMSIVHRVLPTGG